MTTQQYLERLRLLALDKEFMRQRDRIVTVIAGYRHLIDGLTGDIEAVDRMRLEVAEMLRDLDGGQEFREERRC